MQREIGQPRWIAPTATNVARSKISYPVLRPNEIQYLEHEPPRPIVAHSLQLPNSNRSGRWVLTTGANVARSTLSYPTRRLNEVAFFEQDIPRPVVVSATQLPNQRRNKGHGVRSIDSDTEHIRVANKRNT